MKANSWASPVIQSLRLCASTAGNSGLIPTGELRSYMLYRAAKKKKKKSQFPGSMPRGSDSTGQGSGSGMSVVKPPRCSMYIWVDTSHLNICSVDLPGRVQHTDNGNY